MKKMSMYIVIIVCVSILTVLIIQLFGLLEGSRPENLGIQDNKLLDCPKKQNCVSSFSRTLAFDIEPLPFFSTPTESIKKIRQVILGVKGARIITEEKNYIHAECKSFYLGFVDDFEVYCDESKHVCHVRSASRLGFSDFGVNRKRVEKIRKLLLTKE